MEEKDCQGPELELGSWGEERRGRPRDAGDGGRAAGQLPGRRRGQRGGRATPLVRPPLLGCPEPTCGAPASQPRPGAWSLPSTRKECGVTFN